MNTDNISVLRKLVDELEVEYGKFTSGNNSAGTRARKICQQIKVTASTVRDQVQDAREAAVTAAVTPVA